MTNHEIVLEIQKKFKCYWANPAIFDRGVNVNDVVEFVKLKMSESDLGNGYNGMRNKYPTRLPRLCAFDFLLEGRMLSCIAKITKTNSSEDIEYDGELKEIWFNGANIFPVLISVGGLDTIKNHLETNLEKIFNDN